MGFSRPDDASSLPHCGPLRQTFGEKHNVGPHRRTKGTTSFFPFSNTESFEDTQACLHAIEISRRCQDNGRTDWMTKSRNLHGTE